MPDEPTYASYLRLDELLRLQTPRSAGPAGAQHDELLFIIIHQVYELWFKELLHEIDYVQARLEQNDEARASHALRRVLAILKTIVAQVDVLETMTPLEFNAFRGFLGTASGFQSAQFREIEFALGYKRPAIVRSYPEGSAERARLEGRLARPTLWDSFLAYLGHNGYAIPPGQLGRDLREPVEPSPEVQAILVEIYRNNPGVRNICERLVDMDEGFQEWRYRHVKLVERMIGLKTGTGGSTGVQYLASTLQTFFPDLWAIRSLLA